MKRTSFGWLLALVALFIGLFVPASQTRAEQTPTRPPATHVTNRVPEWAAKSGASAPCEVQIHGNNQVFNSLQEAVDAASSELDIYGNVPRLKVRALADCSQGFERDGSTQVLFVDKQLVIEGGYLPIDGQWWEYNPNLRPLINGSNQNRGVKIRLNTTDEDQQNVNFMNIDFVNGNAGQGGGGAIDAEKSWVWVENANFTGNTARVGGAVRGYIGGVILRDVEARNNTAQEGSVLHMNAGHGKVVDSSLIGNNGPTITPNTGSVIQVGEGGHFSMYNSEIAKSPLGVRLWNADSGPVYYNTLANLSQALDIRIEGPYQGQEKYQEIVVIESIFANNTVGVKMEGTTFSSSSNVWDANATHVITGTGGFFNGSRKDRYGPVFFTDPAVNDYSIRPSVNGVASAACDIRDFLTRRDRDIRGNRRFYGDAGAHEACGLHKTLAAYITK